MCELLYSIYFVTVLDASRRLGDSIILLKKIKFNYLNKIGGGVEFATPPPLSFLKDNRSID